MASLLLIPIRSFFFFNNTATTEIYTLSLHDALPISDIDGEDRHDVLMTDRRRRACFAGKALASRAADRDRKSTRLNSSHLGISYAVFCLKKKKNINSLNSIINNKSNPKYCGTLSTNA